jgi:omega-hydroxy-beta-dihydromenaquinone-9 sulfotransferase
LPPRNKYPFYAFRVWQGMSAGVFARILSRNRFAVSPSRLWFAVQLGVHSVGSSMLGVVQRLLFAKRIKRAGLAQAPLIIIGHWRTGTTHLHELLCLDERLTAPTSFECAAPAHFLVSGPLLRWLPFYAPSKRPMDDMEAGFDKPQEDEFALMNLGVNSPYESLMFPNHRPHHLDYVTLTKLTPEEMTAWSRGLLKFLRSVNYRSSRAKAAPLQPQRIVLKSPLHTARLRVLRTLFPQAQFIHLVRHPDDVFASTILTWKALYETQGLQKPRFGAQPDGAPDIKQYVLDMMELLYRDFADETAAIPAQQFCQVRYEDLIRAPLAEIERVYRHFGLEFSNALRAELERHLQTLADYKPNQLAISERDKAEVRRRWGWYFERFGYQRSEL